jgi:glycosyltransferase involved in cell wall biosynthesis
MSKIKVLVIPPDTHGVGKFRILDPFKFIGDNHSDEIHVDFSFNLPNSDDSFIGYDVVVFHSFIHQLSHEENIKRINWLKTNGIKVIMDIDDMWFVDQRHPMYHQIRLNKVGEKKVEMMKLSDHVTTTTPIFAKTIKDRLGLKNVHIFPNAINEKEPQFISNKLESDKIRFGWLGGSSHLHDLELLNNGISTILASYKDKVQFVLCGFDLRGTVTEINSETQEKRQRPIMPMETVWFKYENIFTDKYRYIDEDYKKFLFTFVEQEYKDLDKTYVRRWTKEVNSYASNYNYFDVSLAPLLDTQFNFNKSQLKVIEAGFHKKALIASGVNPYNLDLVNVINEGKFNENGNALIVPPSKNHKEWGKHMKRLIDNPNMIEDMGNRLYETVKDKYSLSNVCKDRVQFLKTLVNK